VKYLAVIPARYGSTRLAGKPLRDICGKPLIQRVYERAIEVGSFHKVVVATDSEEIFSCVEAFGGKAVMTSVRHRSGTERVAEVALLYPSEIIVNIQGDEPLIDPEEVGELLVRFSQEKEAVVGTLKHPIRSPGDFSDPNVVKVVTDLKDYALYFSRCTIPHGIACSGSFNIDSADMVCYKNIGIYAFKRDFLLKYPTLTQTRLERIERLEQLRILEHGYRILVPTAVKDSIGVDTEEDLKKVREIFHQNKAFKAVRE